MNKFPAVAIDSFYLLFDFVSVYRNALRLSNDDRFIIFTDRKHVFISFHSIHRKCYTHCQFGVWFHGNKVCDSLKKRALNQVEITEMIFSYATTIFSWWVTDTRSIAVWSNLFLLIWKLFTYKKSKTFYNLTWVDTPRHTFNFLILRLSSLLITISFRKCSSFAFLRCEITNNTGHLNNEK